MNIDQELDDELKTQRWLAASLVSSLGYEGAVRVCRQMSWYGVLGCLMDRQNLGSRPGPELARRHPSEDAAAAARSS